MTTAFVMSCATDQVFNNGHCVTMRHMRTTIRSAPAIIGVTNETKIESTTVSSTSTAAMSESTTVVKDAIAFVPVSVQLVG